MNSPPFVPRGPARRGLVLSVLLNLFATLVLVGQAALLARVIDGAFLRGATLGDVATPLVAFALAAVVRAAALWGAEVLAARAAAAVRVSARTELLDAVTAAGPAFVERRATGELVTTAMGRVEATDAYVAQYLPQLALAAIVPAIVGGTIAWTDPLSGVVLVVTLPLIPLFMFLIGAHARAMTRRQWVLLARLSARFVDAVRGLAVLKAFGASAREAAAVEGASERFRAVTMAVLRVAFVSALVLELLATIAVAIVAVEVGLRLLYGRIAFQHALFVLVLAPECYRPLRALGASFHTAMSGREAGAEILALAGEALAARPAARPGTGPPATIAGAEDGASGERHGAERDRPDTPARPPRIELAHVTVGYGARRPPALEDVGFTILPGTTLALVGPSGAGKSTVAALLLRFVDAAAGVVTADDVPLTALEPDAWRARVAWVPQRPHVFNGSVRDNLRVARPAADDEAIHQALRDACAAEFLERLPRGLDTPLGERGARLSGGQAQRLALARAFLKDAPLLVLDEPTAQLDPENEHLLAETLRRLRAGRTVLLIAHRLATVADADLVVVLDGGRVREAGRPADLVARGGAFARVVAQHGGAR